MDEVEKKEIEEIKQIFADNGFEDSNGGEEIDILAHDIINKGYGKVEEYKKEIERLRKAKVIYETVDYCFGDLEVALKEVSHLQNVIRKDREQFDERLKRAKQNAIKEVLEKLKHDMYSKSIIQLKGDTRTDLYTDDMEKIIADLLKEYGVEE